MHILVTGASGFIASQIVTDLLAEGHFVTCCVRDVTYAGHLFPKAEIIPCDFLQDTTKADWLPRLKDIDVVINAVGVLYHPNEKIIWDIHYTTPRALFDACVQADVKKIIQISALGIDQSDVAYAKSKKAADDYLLTLPIKSIILRPSLVYGRGSYGGTSLFRGLAGLPSIIPVPGRGEQRFQPIYLPDLSRAILRLVEQPLNETIILSAVGPKQNNLKEILTTLRAWLGFSSAKLLFIPLWLIRLGARLGDFFPYSSMNTTSYKMLMQNNVTSEQALETFHNKIGFVPRDLISGVYAEPSTVQDHWHARLFFLKPLLQYALAFVWLLTAVCSAWLFPKTESYLLLSQVGVQGIWQPLTLYGASLIDAVLGLAMLCNFKLKQVCKLQIIFIFLYSIVLSWQLPALWLDIFAPLAKNIPILVATLILLVLESAR